MREGYKMSEIGVIPEDWKVNRLEEVATVIMGQSPSSDSYNEDKDGLPFFQGNSEFGRIFPTVKKWCNKPLKIAKPLDILISVRAPVGAVNINVESSCIGRGLGSVRAEENMNYRYLYYSLIESEKVLNSSAQGSTFTAINSGELKNLKIKVPNLKEQEKIAEILSTVDSQIDDTEKLIEKSKELKKGLMQKLLTKGIGHSEFKKTEVGEIPVEWEVKKLKDLSTRIGDGLHGTPEYKEEGDFYFINGNNISNKRVAIFENTKTVDESQYIKHKKDLDVNTILISLNGTIGNLGFYNNEKIMLGKSAGYINLNEDVNKIFIYYQLESNRIQSHFIKELTGTTIKNLSLNTLRETKIISPNKDEQEKIAQILLSSDNEIEAYENKKQKLEEVKKGLMQQLLTGKIRVI